MGIVNLTTDSFSGDGCGADPSLARPRARRLIAEGADILDIGAESTRPGSAPVAEDWEIERLVGVIAAVRADSAISISVDTRKPAVARAAFAAGATMWNDTSALRADPESLATAAELGGEVVLMHMQGEPATMQDEPRYGEVVGEVTDFLLARAEAAIAAGVRREAIWIDPGIGFGKTAAHNLALLRATPRFAELGFPLLIGASRKGFIGAIDEAARTPADRLGGSLAVAVAAARAGASAVRVHDVKETVQALAVQRALDG